MPATTHVPRFLLAGLVTALLLAACGGGSDSEPDNPSATTLPPPTQASDSPPSDAVPHTPDSAEIVPAGSPVDLRIRFTISRFRVGSPFFVTVRGQTVTDSIALDLADPATHPAAIEFAPLIGDPITVPLDTDEHIPLRWGTNFAFPKTGPWTATVIRADGSRSNAQDAKTVLVEPESDLLEPFAPLSPRPIQIAILPVGGSTAEIVGIATSHSTAWLSDPERFLFMQTIDDVPMLVTADPTTGEITPFRPPGVDSGRIDAAPDGRHFLLRGTELTPRGTRQSVLRLVDAQTGSDVLVPQDPNGFGRPSWSPDSQHFIVQSLHLRIFDTTGTRVAESTAEIERAYDILWAPDGSFAFLGPMGDGSVLRIDVPSGVTTTLLAAEDVEADRGSLSAFVALSPDGRRIAASWRPAGSSDWRLVIVPTTATHADLLAAPPVFGLPNSTGSTPRAWLFSLSWSPDSRQLAFTTIQSEFDLTSSTMWIVDPTTGLLRDFGQRSNVVTLGRFPPAWSPDGSQLLAVRFNCITQCDGSLWGSTLYDVDSGTILIERENLFNASPDDQPFQFLRTPDGLFDNVDLTDPVVAFPGTTPHVSTSPSGTFAVAVISVARSTTVRYAVRPDGTGHEFLGVESLDNQPEGATFDLDSPDGTRRAALLLDGLHIREPDGSLTKLSDVSVRLKTVFWSPDGSQIVYKAAEAEHLGDFIVANTDGSGAYVLMHATQNSRLFGWQPDGRIVYVTFPGN